MSSRPHRTHNQLALWTADQEENALSEATGTTPFLKWAGGKSQLLSQLLPHVPPEFNTYIEPFLGGGAMFFRLQPDKAVLTDSNRDLINCYSVVRDQVEQLIVQLRGYEANHSEEFYYWLRSQPPDEEIARAARFVYLNRTCYNGLYRVNKKGQFNVPFGRYESPTICDSDRLRAASHALQGTRLECADYRETLDKYAHPGDFVYIDPPYYPVSKYSDFKRYTSDFFYAEDHRELAKTASELAQRGCHVLVSNSFSDFVLDLYGGCKIIEVTARRNINKDPTKRSEIKEVLILCS